ncbi:hypothetical protein [Butyrivibrio sp. INlla16]|uniref:hypothetical protein n=1 Tax=Butyrivibrio sp. INlla16 TaxID=1520807 RepID=UPI00087E2655|nr:hypothetical protein [Butyrivibrio sp. INlla16]SDB67347.1 hypothetical protein SAMN02910263_03950 [Butyrivibrio sp. INlla16]
MSQKVVILVMGRDQTIKLSYLTSFFFEKFWTKRQIKCVLVTQTTAPKKHYYDEVIYTKPDAIWGERLELALEQIKEEYIILSQEDFFISKEILEENIFQCVRYMDEHKSVAAIRLNSFSLNSRTYDELFNIVEKGMPYRICGQPTIFRKEYLYELSKRHFNPWQFEIDGSEYSDSLEGEVLVSKYDRYPYVHAWTKGAWTRDAIELMKSFNVQEKYYINDNVYPLYKEMLNRIWSICFRVSPNLLTRLTKKRNRTN